MASLCLRLASLVSGISSLAHRQRLSSIQPGEVSIVHGFWSTGMFVCLCRLVFLFGTNCRVSDDTCSAEPSDGVDEF